MKRKHSNINYFPTNASEIENVIWHSKKHFSVFTYFLFSFCHIEKYIKLRPYDPPYQHQKSAADSTNNYRSSRLQVFCEKCVLKNFAKFIGKHLCRSLFFNEVAGLNLATLLKKRHWHRCFPVNRTLTVAVSSKVACQLYWNRTSTLVFSCKFAAYFQNTFFVRTLMKVAPVYINVFN